MAPLSPLQSAQPWAPDVAAVRWRGTAGSYVLRWVIVAIFTALGGFIVVVNAYTRNPAKHLTGLHWLTPIGTLLLGLVISLWTSRVAVEVDDDELRVRFGPGWPVRHIRWERVKSVEAIDVRPTQWGGWGYKVQPLRHAQAVVMRGGPGLKLTLDNETLFVITVDDAKRGLEVIRGILATK